MNWVSALNDLYEKNADRAGIYDETEKLVLLPMSHTTVAAQIEVSIDSTGQFIGAEAVDKANALTIIPVTEKSGSRTSSPVPHPLCDNLKFLAGDYSDLIYLKSKGDGKKEKDFTKDFYAPYIEGLEKWCGSCYNHLKAEAILNYLKKSRLIRDLIDCNVLKPDDEGKISDKVKIQNIAQVDSFVRFRVEDGGAYSPEEILADASGYTRPEVWLDRTLQQSFIGYYKTITGVVGFCYLSGEETQIADLHPKKIRNEGDGAKLISANDSDYYTFRGRFRDKNEAFSIGYETSQKAHNALKWIIRKQGYTRDGLCAVVWESNLQPLVTPFDDTLDISKNRFEDEEEEQNETYDTNNNAARHFNAALNGYKTELGESSNTVIMALDAATPGRLSITYFKDLQSSHYLENIRYWHESCCWLHEKSIEKKLYRFEGMASLKDIALLLYGTEQNKILALRSNSDGKTPMLISTFNRLLPCITERKGIPDDMVKTAVARASTPLSYEYYNWKRIVAVACSLVKKQRYEKNKEEWTMPLDPNCRNRDYLYGRLLAIADRIEYLTYNKEKDSDRQTNAKRYMNAFSQRPFRTWRVIREKIQPYLNKLNAGRKIYYSHLLDEIMDKFDVNEFSDEKNRLDGLYLLGFHCQSHAFIVKNPEEKGENTGEEERESAE